MSYTSERYSKDVVRVLSGVEIIGFLLRCGDDRWAIVDKTDRTVTKRRFLKPKDAMLFITENGFPGLSA